MRTTGYLVATPAEFPIHRRFGRTRRQGRDPSVFCLPLIDRVPRIPSTAQALAFQAGRTTAENPGVGVGGFATWKPSDSRNPSTASPSPSPTC